MEAALGEDVSHGCGRLVAILGRADWPALVRVSLPKKRSSRNGPCRPRRAEERLSPSPRREALHLHRNAATRSRPTRGCRRRSGSARRGPPLGFESRESSCSPWQQLEDGSRIVREAQPFEDEEHGEVDQRSGDDRHASSALSATIAPPAASVATIGPAATRAHWTPRPRCCEKTISATVTSSWEIEVPSAAPSSENHGMSDEVGEDVLCGNDPVGDHHRPLSVLRDEQRGRQIRDGVERNRGREEAQRVCRVGVLAPIRSRTIGSASTSARRQRGASGRRRA